MAENNTPIQPGSDPGSIVNDPNFIGFSPEGRPKISITTGPKTGSENLPDQGGTQNVASPTLPTLEERLQQVEGALSAPNSSGSGASETPGTGQSPISSEVHPPISTTGELPGAQPNPSAVDDALAKQEELARQAMKEGGFTGYVPPLSGISGDPEGASALHGAVTDFFAAFNRDLARAVALPEEVTQRGLALLGVDYMEHGTPTQRTIDALNRMGIPIYQIDNMANRMGHGALPALATWATMQASAPYMAARTGMTATQMTIKNIGEWAIQHPVLGLWLGQTSNMGGTVADESLPNGPVMSPMKRLGGELLGGGIGTTTAKMAAATGRAAMIPGRLLGRGVNALADSFPTAFGNAIKAYNPLYKVQPTGIPLAEPGVGLTTLGNYAENQVAGLKMRIDDAVINAIDSIPQRGSSAVQQRVAHLNLQEAERISNNIVEQAWNRVPNVRVPMGEARRDLQALRTSLEETPSVAPFHTIDEAINLSSPVRDPATGRMIASTPTLRRVRDMFNQIRTEIKAEQASDAPRDGYVRNLNQIRSILEDTLSNNYPNMTALQQARAASTMHHDLFSRGPIADVLAKRYRGDFRVNPDQSVDRLTNTEGGLQAVLNMRNTLSTATVGTGRNRTLAIQPQDRAILDTLVRDIEQTLRNNFREAAATNGPAGAVRYQQSVQDSIRSFSRVAGELQLAAKRVGTALELKKDIEKSALSRFAETAPEKAIANLWAQKNPANIARQLIRTFQGDPDAMSGLRNEAIRHLLYDRAKNDPLNMRKLMDTPRIADLYREILTGDQWRRMNKIVNDAIRVTMGQDKGFREKYLSRISLFGRVIGSHFGRAIMMHHGTLQTQSIFAKAGANIAESLFKSVPPDALMTMAILDPRWEKLLYSRFPISLKEMRVAQAQYRRLFAVLDSERQDAYNRIKTMKGVPFNNAMPQP